MTSFESTLWTVIRRAGAGEQDALRAFVQRYRAPIVAYCARRGCKADAEDLAQQVLVRLTVDGALAKADPAKGPFRRLLFTITRRVIASHLERERAQKRGGGKVVPLDDHDVASEAPDSEFDRAWVAHLLESAMARLSREHPNYHEALRLSLGDGQTYASIGKTMDKRESDVKNYLHRGRQKLIEYMGAEVCDCSRSREEYEAEMRYLSRFLSDAASS